MKPKVSVIIPVYNGEKYISHCLESLNIQTLRDIEIIFVNDGSRDRSSKLLNDISSKQRNVRVVHLSNSGPGAARNVGISVATGEYIGFVDVDDRPTPNMFEKMYEVSVSYNADMTICGFLEVGENGNRTERKVGFNDRTVLESQDILNEILKPALRHGGGIYAPVWNKLYRLSWVRSVNIYFPEERNYGEDWFFNQLALGRAKRIAVICEPLYLYMRINPNSIMFNYRNDLFSLHLSSRHFLEQRMLEWQLTSNQDKLNANTRFCEKVFEAIVNEMSPKNSSFLFNKFKFINNIVIHDEVQFAAKNAEKNVISFLLKDRHSIILGIFAWYLAVTKPVLHKFKVAFIKAVFS